MPVSASRPSNNLAIVMPRIRTIFGATLLTLTATCVVQTTREVLTGTSARWTGTEVRADSFAFAGHAIAIARPAVTSTTDRHQLIDEERVLIDGAPVGATRTQRTVGWPLGDGRRSPHWLTVMRFVDRDARDSSLWIARRVQHADMEAPRFEVVTVDARGKLEVRTHAADELSGDYRLGTVTALIGEDVQPTFPFSVVPLLWFSYLLVLLPVTTGVLGFMLLRRGRKPHTAT